MIWKQRYEICFQSSTRKRVISIILLIISVFEYWTGHIDKRIKEGAEEWLPEDINAIPLRVWDPSDNQLVVYQGAEYEAAEELMLALQLNAMMKDNFFV